MSAYFNSLTAKQKKVYSAIETYIRLKGIPPTVREIGEMVGEKTPGAVQGILNRLEQKGVIKRQLGAARSIQLISPDSQLYSDPVYIPEIKKVSKRNIDDLMNIYNISKFHPFPSGFVNADGKYLIMQCPDDSMAAKGISLKDILIVNTAATPDKGDVIIVFYEGRTYLRYYFPEEGSVTLTADENLLDKTVFSPDEFKVIGRLEGKYSRI